MPVLELETVEGGLHPFASWDVLAVMFYPLETEEHQEKRLEFKVNELVAHHLQIPGLFKNLPQMLPIAAEWLPVAHNAPRPAEVRAAAVEGAKHAWVAAEVLLLLLAAAEHHPEIAPNPTQAVDVLSRELGRLEQPKKWPSKPRALHDWWRKFRSVAHFYLLLRRLEAYAAHKSSAPDPEMVGDMLHGDISGFLAMAEIVRKKAVTRRFINSLEIWTAPEDLALPMKGREFDIPPLSEPRLELFKTYRPEHYVGIDGHR